MQLSSDSQTGSCWFSQRSRVVSVSSIFRFICSSGSFCPFSPWSIRFLLSLSSSADGKQISGLHAAGTRLWLLPYQKSDVYLKVCEIHSGVSQLVDCYPKASIKNGIKADRYIIYRVNACCSFSRTHNSSSAISQSFFT